MLYNNRPTGTVRPDKACQYSIYAEERKYAAWLARHTAWERDQSRRDKTVPPKSDRGDLS